MKLKALAVFQDIKTHKVYDVGDVIEISDKERAENLISRNLCEKEKEEDNSKKVTFGDAEFDLKAVKEALKSIDLAVAQNAGVDAVVKKLAELTEEQSKSLAEILSA